MNALIEWAINRSRTTLLLLFMILLAGTAARMAIPVEAEPRIEVPYFVIIIVHEGITPEDSERLLVLPVEAELRSVEGIKEIQTFGSEGRATITVEFDAEFDLNQAGVDVREAVDRAKPKIPGTAEEPMVLEMNTDDRPIIQINLIGDEVPERMKYTLAVTLKDRLKAIPQVLDATLGGHREEMLEAVIDPTLLESYQISNEELINTVLRNNRLVASGSLDTGLGRFSVKVPSVIETATDLFNLPVKTDGDTVVTLADVAQVKRTFKDRTSYSSINGNSGITINVSKRSNANLIATVKLIREVVDDMRPDFPRKLTVFMTQDQAPHAERQVTELQGNILTALVLVMIIVVAAMGFRTGVIVGFSIPVAFLFALILLYSIGYTFNMMVMFGMLLGLGMLIDGAIVVSEYADRKMIEGMNAHDAYALAAKRMFWPVTASVATTLAAFLPLMLWPGVAGMFMAYLPVTVFTVLMGSLIYALIIAPTLGSIFGRAGNMDAKSALVLKEMEQGDPTKLKNLTGIYARILEKASRFAPLTLAATVGLLILTFMAYGKFGNGVIFFNDADPQYASVLIKARGNLSTQESSALLLEVEEEVLKIAGIEEVNSTTQDTSGSFFRGTTPPDTVGIMYLSMHEESDRELLGEEILELIRNRTAHLAGVEIEVQKMENGPPTGKAIQIQLASRYRELLDPAIEHIRSYLENNVTGLRDFEDSRPLPGIEWKLDVDRAQAALFGADVAQVGLAVQLVTNGVLVSKYRPDGAEDEVDIRVRFPIQARGIGALDELNITTPKGKIPLSNFVVRTPVQQVDTLQRIDGIPVGSIQASVAPGILADTKVKEIQAWLATEVFDPRLKVEFRGANEEQEKTFAFLGGAFILSLLLMFALLVTQFNSLYQSTLILFAVIMSTAGVLLGLIVTQSPFSAILTGTGVVALAGIVVNNNIVLIDTYNHLKEEHPELDYIALIVRTGAQRLRPVMLTTVTTVFGLLPMSMNWSIDIINRTMVHGGQVSSQWVPLAQSIVWGLSIATVLTLVATPAMLAIPHQIKGLFQRDVQADAAPAVHAESQ